MHKIIIRQLGLSSYGSTWQQMKSFTQHRTEESLDELWFTEHFPVFTQGQAGKPEHILDPKEITIMQTDRGGQVTYHAPGQVVFYPLINLRRKNLTPTMLVHTLEKTIIAVLADYHLQGITKKQAPGVYIADHKIAFLGLRIRRGCSYHGASLNVNMDLTPFSNINPCGFPNLKVIQMSDFNQKITIEAVIKKLITHLTQHLDYSDYTTIVEHT
jgi:lipoyl(octanoyl) transferase